MYMNTSIMVHAYIYVINSERKKNSQFAINRYSKLKIAVYISHGGNPRLYI